MASQLCGHLTRKNPRKATTTYSAKPHKQRRLSRMTPRRYKRNQSKRNLSKIPRKLNKLNTICVFSREIHHNLLSVLGIKVQCKICNSYLAQTMPEIIASNARQTATHLRRSNMPQLQQCVADIVTKFEYPPQLRKECRFCRPRETESESATETESASQSANDLDCLSRPRVNGIRVTVPGPKGPRALQAGINLAFRRSLRRQARHLSDRICGWISNGYQDKYQLPVVHVCVCECVCLVSLWPKQRKRRRAECQLNIFKIFLSVKKIPKKNKKLKSKNNNAKRL